MGCLCSNPEDSSGTKLENEKMMDDKPSQNLEKSPYELREVDNIWKIFEFKKNLGAGASCQVCLVSKRDTQVQYALKMMEFKFERLFEREVKTLKLSDCPNIVRLEGAYKDSKMQYICMEYCSGMSLLQRLSTHKTYTEGISANCAKEMLLALKYLHDMNIIHRDLKPANFVYLTKDSNAGLKLLDFGLAKLVDPLEQYTFHAGTPYFMAPELVHNMGTRSGEGSKKIDMWAFGVCLFAILNGKLPFEGQNRSELFHNIVKQRNLKFRTKGLSSEAKDLIFKLLRRNPDKRITVDEALEHPWILRSGMNENEILQSTVEALKLFHAKHSVHRALQRLAAQKVTKHDIDYFKQLFDRFDRNGDGKISKDECVAVLEGSLMYPIEAVKIAEEMIKNADDNKDEMISWEEFQYSIARRELSHNEYKMHAVFSALDINRDGYISIEELVHCLQSEQWQAEDESLRTIVEVFENATGNSGRMTFDAFKKILSDVNLRESTFKTLDNCELNEVLDNKGTVIDDEKRDIPVELVEDNS